MIIFLCLEVNGVGENEDTSDWLIYDPITGGMINQFEVVYNYITITARPTFKPSSSPQISTSSPTGDPDAMRPTPMPIRVGKFEKKKKNSQMF